MSANYRWPVAGVVASLLAISGAPLLAQEYNGAFTFGYSSGSIGDSSFSDDLTQTSFHGDITVQFPDGFRFGARLSHEALDIDSIPPTFDFTTSEINAGYAMPSGAWFGVYSEKFGVTVEGAPFTFNFDTYGIEGGTTVGGVDVKAFYGTGNQMTSYGLSGRYEAERFVAGGYYAHTDLDVDSDTLDFDSYGIGGAYQISQQFGVFAGAGTTALSGSVPVDVDIVDYGIGVSYDMTAMVNLPLVASLEYSAETLSNLGPDDITNDGFTLSVTVPMGNSQGIVVPANSVAGAALNPTHNAINSLVLIEVF